MQPPLFLQYYVNMMSMCIPYIRQNMRVVGNSLTLKQKISFYKSLSPNQVFSSPFSLFHQTFSTLQQGSFIFTIVLDIPLFFSIQSLLTFFFFHCIRKNIILTFLKFQHLENPNTITPFYCYSFEFSIIF